MDVNGEKEDGGDFVVIETSTAILCDGSSQDSVGNLKRACDSDQMARDAFGEVVANTEYAEFVDDPSALVDHAHTDLDLPHLENDPERGDADESDTELDSGDMPVAGRTVGADESREGESGGEDGEDADAGAGGASAEDGGDKSDSAAAAGGEGKGVAHVYHSHKFIDSRNVHQITMLFPHLDPFGVLAWPVSDKDEAVSDEDLRFARRRNHYSKAQIAQCLLLQHDRRIALDHSFKFFAFDLLAKARVMTNSYLRALHSPDVVKVANTISKDQFVAGLKHELEVQRAARVGRAIPQAPAGVAASGAADVFKLIASSVSPMWGTNGERGMMRKDLDALMIKHGSPSLFWTFVPNPDKSYSLHILASGPEGLKQSSYEDFLKDPTANPKAVKVDLNARDPIGHYLWCTQVLIEKIFGWDTKNRRPHKERGVFGFLDVFCYAEESQGRLTVHHHGVAWIAGMPRTQAEWLECMKVQAFKDRFNGISSVFKSDLPVLQWAHGVDKTQPIPCLEPGCDGVLESVPIDALYHHWSKRSMKPLLHPAVLSQSVADHAMDVPSPPY
ncbi:hypothetical protein BCR44DRAFT_1045637 [Catenaria anguillulae PL171]|uniref:Helitron helicase-like domain-containing protein n=1 Tax=Catenaria anguillulae PL171 TaxID=765915 RepID=A0A1Y2H6W1_9FUNG|nr:hypothetical protein BCR44DRAFT_1045637 [Catenaria anguillulae PL171]